MTEAQHADNTEVLKTCAILDIKTYPNRKIKQGNHHSLFIKGYNIRKKKMIKKINGDTKRRFVILPSCLWAFILKKITFSEKKRPTVINGRNTIKQIIRFMEPYTGIAP